MYKKIFISLFLLVILATCGKKTDPIYQEKNGLNNWKINGSSVVKKN